MAKIRRVHVGASAVGCLCALLAFAEVLARVKFGPERGPVDEPPAVHMKAWGPFFRVEGQGATRVLVQDIQTDHVESPVQRLSVEKKAGMRRLLILGESTAAMLGPPLRRLISESSYAGELEVMNCGVGGASLEQVEEKFDETIRYDPDAVFLVFGNNLFLRYPDPSSVMDRLGTAARKSRLISYLAGLAGGIARPSAAAGLTGRLAAFDRFLRKAAARCRRRNVRLFLYTFANNLWFPPQARRDELDNPLYLEALYQRAIGREDRAAELLRSLCESKPVALWHYQLGAALERLGDHRGAYEHLTIARDLDTATGVRASTAVNAVIRSVAREENLGLLDAEQLVQERAPHGLPGYESFYSDCHLTPAMFGKMAFEILGLVASDAGARRPRYAPGAEAKRRALRAFLRWASHGKDFFAARWPPASLYDGSGVLAIGEKRAASEIGSFLAQAGGAFPGERDQGAAKAQFLLRLAGGLWPIGYRDTALKLNEQARGLSPAWEEPYVQLGLLALRSGEAGRAHALFRKACGLNRARRDVEFFLERTEER